MAPVADSGLNPRNFGQSRHAVRTAGLSLVLKIIMQLTVAIDLAAVLPSFFLQIGLSLIFQSPFAEWPPQPRIEPTRVNCQHAAHATHTELLVMPFDECALHFASLAKYAVASLGCHAPR